jgi:hypothetical protein
VVAVTPLTRISFGVTPGASTGGKFAPAIDVALPRVEVVVVGLAVPALEFAHATNVVSATAAMVAVQRARIGRTPPVPVEPTRRERLTRFLRVLHVLRP